VIPDLTTLGAGVVILDLTYLWSCGFGIDCSGDFSRSGRSGGSGPDSLGGGC
jgi:hypothetical protein